MRPLRLMAVLYRKDLSRRADTGLYIMPWNTYISALRADARTNNDNVANASLPGSALSTNIRPGSANGRAVGLNTPPAMFANGTVGQGGPYDGDRYIEFVQAISVQPASQREQLRCTTHDGT